MDRRLLRAQLTRVARPEQKAVSTYSVICNAAKNGYQPTGRNKGWWLVLGPRYRDPRPYIYSLFGRHPRVADTGPAPGQVEERTSPVSQAAQGPPTRAGPPCLPAPGNLISCHCLCAPCQLSESRPRTQQLCQLAPPAPLAHRFNIPTNLVYPRSTHTMPPKHVVESTPAEESFADDDPRFAAVEEIDFDNLTTQRISEHVWTNSRYQHVIVPFEHLPLPSVDRTRIEPCTVRFQFTGPFKTADRDNARNSFWAQLKTFLARFGDRRNATPIQVNFPSGVGRGKFVDITSGPMDVDKIARANLTFKKHKLERIVVGPKLPPNTRILEIVDVPANLSSKSASQGVAFQLQARDVGQLLDMWKVTSSVAPEHRDIAGACDYTLVAAIRLCSLPNGAVASTTTLNLPGWLKLDNRHCMVKFRERPDWCSRCKGDATHFHLFGNCPRLECFDCKGRGHTADHCPAKGVRPGDQPMDVQGERPTERPSKRPTPAQ